MPPDAEGDFLERLSRQRVVAVLRAPGGDLAEPAERAHGVLGALAGVPA